MLSHIVCYYDIFSLFFFFSFWYVFLETKIALYFHLFHVIVTNASTDSCPCGNTAYHCQRHQAVCWLTCFPLEMPFWSSSSCSNHVFLPSKLVESRCPWILEYLSSPLCWVSCFLDLFPWFTSLR